MTKPPSSKPKRGKRGPPSDAHVIASVRDERLTRKIAATAEAAMDCVTESFRTGRDIPQKQLTAFRLLLEWHTAYLAVRDTVEDEERP